MGSGGQLGLYSANLAVGAEILMKSDRSVHIWGKKKKSFNDSEKCLLPELCALLRGLSEAL